MEKTEKQLSKFIQTKMLKEEKVEFPSYIIQIYIEQFLKENSLQITRSEMINGCTD